MLCGGCVDVCGCGFAGAAGEGSLFDILDSDGEEELEWGEFEDDDLEAAGRGVDNALSGDSAQLGDDLLFSEEGKVEFPDYTVQEQRRLIELVRTRPRWPLQLLDLGQRVNGSPLTDSRLLLCSGRCQSVVFQRAVGARSGLGCTGDAGNCQRS